jgi:hypothetical protein
MSMGKVAVAHTGTVAAGVSFVGEVWSAIDVRVDDNRRGGQA